MITWMPLEGHNISKKLRECYEGAQMEMRYLKPKSYFISVRTPTQPIGHDPRVSMVCAHFIPSPPKNPSPQLTCQFCVLATKEPLYILDSVFFHFIHCI